MKDLFVGGDAVIYRGCRCEFLMYTGRRATQGYVAPLTPEGKRQPARRVWLYSLTRATEDAPMTTYYINQRLIYQGKEVVFRGYANKARTLAYIAPHAGSTLAETKVPLSALSLPAAL